MIENILILDTETTGLDPAKGDKLIEVAGVLYNLKHKCILQSYASLLPCEENPVEKINGISVAMTKCPYPQTKQDLVLQEMSHYAQALVAHNAEFDKKFIATMFLGYNLLQKPWICTKSNFTWPCKLSRLRLQDICEGMGVPYINAHRALADCLMLAQCFSNVPDLEERFLSLLPVFATSP